MAVCYAGIAATDGPQVIGSDVVFAASGGTLAGSQLVQVVYDDSVFTTTQESKQRLLASLQLIIDRIATAKLWPVTSAS